MKDYLFFSIIIPAHNEEKYIGDTLEHVARLNYPADRYEVIVVENNSIDQTYREAKKFERDNISVVRAHTKGVSAAKNMGIDLVSKTSDWVIFLDADTIVKEKFLTDLNKDLLGRNEHCMIGTTSILPRSRQQKALWWFWLYDIGHWLTSSSYSLQIVKRSLLKEIRFEESLAIGEDLYLIEEARKKGSFFFLWIKDVVTSTRRFDREGWVKVFFYWLFVAMLPRRYQRRFTYKVIR